MALNALLPYLDKHNINIAGILYTETRLGADSIVAGPCQPVKDARLIKDIFFAGTLSDFCSKKEKGKNLTLRQIVEERGIPICQYIPFEENGLSAGEIVHNIILEHKPDSVFSLDFHGALIAPTLDLYKDTFPIMGIHPGPLPQAPGLLAGLQQIIKGGLKYGDEAKVSIHILGDRLDTGSIVDVVNVKYKHGMTPYSLRKVSYLDAVKVLGDDVLPRWLSSKGAFTGYPQTKEEKFPRLYSSEIVEYCGELGWRRMMSPLEIINDLNSFLPEGVLLSYMGEDRLPTNLIPYNEIKMIERYLFENDIANDGILNRTKEAVFYLLNDQSSALA